MIHSNERIIKHKIGLLNLAEELGNVSRWSQFIALGLAQLSGRSSLRDIVSNMGAQMNKLYHLGTASVSRSSLARVNEPVVQAGRRLA